MNVVLHSILDERSGVLFDALRSEADYTPPQAYRFLPEAVTAIAGAIVSKASKLDHAEPASPSNIGAVLSGVDVSGLAGRSDLSAEQVAVGLETIVPMMLRFLADKAESAGGLAALLGSRGGLGGGLGSVKDSKELE